MKLRYLLCLVPLALTGCVGFNTALFMTKSNAGLDFDMKPPTVEINISRKEGVVEPSFEGGKTPPVMASFSTKSGAADGLHRFFFGVDQTFSGGDAAVTMAKLYDSPSVPADDAISKDRFNSGVALSRVPVNNSATGKGMLGWKKFLFGLPEPGEVRPFFFGTDSQLGVKVGWNGVGGPYPDNVKIGYNRKEIAVAPVSYAPRETLADGRTIHTNVVRIPSFLATVDSDVEAETGVSVSWMQYFATGEAASQLARQPAVRGAMIQRADSLASEKAPAALAAKIEDQKKTGTNLATEVAVEVKRLTSEQLESGAKAAIDSGLWPQANLEMFNNETKGKTGEEKDKGIAKQRRYLTATAENRGTEDDIQRLRKYLENLKAIK